MDLQNGLKTAWKMVAINSTHQGHQGPADPAPGHPDHQRQQGCAQNHQPHVHRLIAHQCHVTLEARVSAVGFGHDGQQPKRCNERRAQGAQRFGPD
jgi:hypothetical protein